MVYCVRGYFILRGIVVLVCRREKREKERRGIAIYRGVALNSHRKPIGVSVKQKPNVVIPKLHVNVNSRLFMPLRRSARGKDANINDETRSAPFISWLTRVRYFRRSVIT